MRLRDGGELRYNAKEALVTKLVSSMALLRSCSVVGRQAPASGSAWAMSQGGGHVPGWAARCVEESSLWSLCSVNGRTLRGSVGQRAMHRERQTRRTSTRARLAAARTRVLRTCDVEWVSHAARRSPKLAESTNRK